MQLVWIKVTELTLGLEWVTYPGFAALGPDGSAMEKQAYKINFKNPFPNPKLF